ncbi:MAG TPA: hypothetical protein VFG71_11690 [Nitrospiraceae bacterium]|nr:hypothetical protein [Nitrospiraceae bacterium]
MTAQEWFKVFSTKAKRDKQFCRLVNKSWPREVPEGKWTPALRDLLVRMAKTDGYQVANEARVVCNQRADQRWLEGRISQVIIEHENRSDKNLDGESEKRRNVSKLKVLITYAPDRNFDKEASKVAERVRGAIASQAGSFSGEFLLAVAGYREHDFIGFRSVIQPKMEKT